MSRTGHKLLAGSGAADAYEIEQSLMLPDDANAHLLKNISSAGNRKTWTWSGWVKRYKLQGSSSTVSYFLWSAYDNSTEDDETWFSLQFYRDDIRIGAWTQNYRVTSRLFRDLNAWYHIVLAVDTTQSTANDRIKLYINGVQETGFDSPSNPSQNANLGIGNTTWHMLGSVNASGTTGYAKHYIAETHFIDGTALTADSFGKRDSVTNQWIPKKYTGGSYGTNGYYLKFASGAIGTDSSGQGNNYTASNVADSDVMLDVPTNNFCYLNPLETGGCSTLAQGNLHKSGSHDQAPGTFWFSSGKWYCEVAILSGSGTGSSYNYALYVNDSKQGAAFTGWTKDFVALTLANGGNSPDVFQVDTDTNGTVTQPTGSRPAATAIIGIALDVDNGNVEYYINGSLNGKCLGITDWTLPVTINLAYATSTIAASSNNQVINFGQNGTFCGNVTAGGNADGNGYGNFKYSPPSGYLAMCTANLPAPTVKKPTDHFNAKNYTGNDADDRTITGVGFQPDLVWIKARNEAANWHTIFDSVRGVSKRIFPNDTNIELTEADPNNSLVAFTSDGFTVDDSSGHSDLNASAHYYVSYNWKAGTTFSNDASATSIGTIDSSGSANADAGISIVKFTMPSSGQATVKHGLSVKPKVLITKDLENTYNWATFHEDVTDTTSKFMRLNTDDDIVTYSTVWGAALPTSSVFGVTAGGLAAASADVIAYCFAEVEGFSSFGTYEANNSTDGPFVYTGFTPAWVVFKYFDGDSEWWWMFDNRRGWVQPNTVVLYPNAPNAEATVSSSGAVDFLSNGFKIRATNGGINYQNSYMYMAFAEYPFKYANAR